MIAALLVAQLAFAAPPLEVMPLVYQGGVLVMGDDITAGGLGGGLGAQLVIDRRWIVQADVGALWLAGQAWLARVAAGAQMNGTWRPAAALTVGTLWGDRIEHIGSDARRPPIPTWALGVRLAALRFGGAAGVVSALELGVGSDLGGALWLELTLLQAAAHW